MIDWRDRVYKRDDYTCQWCSARSGNGRAVHLNADHIIRFSDVITTHSITDYQQAMRCDALWDIANGRTLCLSCHKKTDTFGRRKHTGYALA